MRVVTIVTVVTLVTDVTVVRVVIVRTVLKVVRVVTEVILVKVLTTRRYSPLRGLTSKPHTEYYVSSCCVICPICLIQVGPMSAEYNKIIVGLLLAPADGFGLRPRPFWPLANFFWPLAKAWSYG